MNGTNAVRILRIPYYEEKEVFRSGPRSSGMLGKRGRVGFAALAALPPEPDGPSKDGGKLYIPYALDLRTVVAFYIHINLRHFIIVFA